MTTSPFPRLLPLLCTFTFFIICPSLFAQQTQYDRGTPPQHAAGVSSLGSYSSAEVGTVNLSNGALNLKFSLGSVGGRGFSLPLTLNWSSKLWSAATDTDEDRDGSTKTVVYADFARGDDSMAGFSLLGPGWTIGAAPTITAQIVRINPLTSGPNVGCYTYTVPKLTVILPDKGEIEFRDDAYNGMPLASDCSGYISASRGTRWHATNGSGAVFINSVNNGVAGFNTSGEVITADGMRYHFLYSLCDSITDRNGNKITFELIPTGLKITDQLGRITKVEQNVPDPQNTSVTLPLLVTVPGYNGQSRYYKLKTGIMNQYYRSDINPTLPVVSGDYDPLSKGYRWATATRLFRFSYGLYQQRIDVFDEPTELVLPDNRSLRFKYNEYGEVAELQMPTGGKVWYDYEYSSTPAGNSPFWETSGDLHTTVDVDRVLTQRRLFPDGNTNTPDCTWHYTYGGSAEVSATAADGTLMLDEIHYFLPAERYYTYIPTGSLTGTHYSKWTTGIEYRVENRNAVGVVIGATEQDWIQRAPLAWPSYPQEQPANDNRVNESRRYLETGMMSKVGTTYDQYNNPIEVKEYDFDQTLKRRTMTSYLNSNLSYNYQSDDAIHLMSLPETQTVYDGNNNQLARTVTEYDVYTDDTSHAALTDYGSNVSQHNTAFGTSKITRGNPTRVGQWLNTTGSYIYSYPRYDTLGNVVSIKDARGFVSTISFADDFGLGNNPGTPTQNPAIPTYALPTLITSPPPQAGALAHTARSQYDYATGLLTGFRDRNNVVTQTIYDDPFNRPTQVNSALTISGVENHTLIYYAPITTFGITLANNDVLTAKDQTTLNDHNLRSWTVTDGFGRTKESWNRDPQGDVQVITVYDALGRVKQVSNPFRLGEAADFTTTTYDNLGRVTQLKTPDNAVVSTSYNANTVTVTDQAGKARKSVTDGLGRLIEVVEDPGDGTRLNYQTTYTYDTLDNLVKVTQGTQQRFFMYDSLKRLIRARNPEHGTHSNLDLSDPITLNNNWSMAYEYDAGGNLTKKTDARAVYSTYAYDALNRNTEINYSDTSFSPDVKRFYDGATQGVGRLWYASKGDDSAANNVEKTSIDSYDELGRPLNQQQLFKLNGQWKSYPVTRTYNLAGSALTQSYPSTTHSVSYLYDSAGRTTSFSGNLGGDPRTYATDITYSSWGSIGREKFGTDALLYHKSFYNIRGQLFDTRLSSKDDLWDWNRGRLILYYSSNHLWGQSGTDNNGNVRFAETWIPPVNATLDQTDTLFEESYDYDELNRLNSVAGQKKKNLAGVWEDWQQQFRQSYHYDRYGNRTIITDPLDPLHTWGTGINYKQFEPNVGNKNQLGVPSGQTGVMSYDAAGNLANDTYSGAGAREYDAENKMTRAWVGNNQWQEYTYNADGQRTRRKVNGSEKWQIYGMDGELLAEYAAGASVTSPQKEYGYRNGQLLITASLGSSSGSSSNSLSVNGTTAYAEVPNSTTLNIAGPMTMEAWVKLPAVSTTYQPIIDHSPSLSNEGGYDMYVTDTGKARMDIFYGTSYQWLIGATTLSANVWHHIAGVYDGSQLRLYVDGQLDASVNLSSPMTGTAVQLRIGRNNYLYTPIYFNGLIDEVRISTGALYSSNFTPAASLTTSGSTRGLWKFDGQTVSDSSANGNNGTLNGGATYSSDVPSGGGGPESVVWTGAANVTVNGNSLTKSAATTAWDAGANSTKAIVSGNGYVEMTITETNKDRFFGLSDSETTVSYEDIDFSMRAYSNGVVYCYEPGTNGAFCGYYSPGDKLRVAIEGGAVKYYLISGSTSTLVYTATHPATYPMAADAAIYNSGGTITNAVISGNLSSGGGGGGSGGSSNVQWLVTDHLGTPRMMVDQTGSFASVKRHDYLPFGEELYADIGGRTTSLGYTPGDGVRQQFTQKERDTETGLDYFLARYYSSVQGRFTSSDEFKGDSQELFVGRGNDSKNRALAYADITNPQSLNKYQYCFNNPLRYTDSNGQTPQDSLELNFERDVKALLAGKMTEQEFRSRMNARGVGAAIGAAIVAAYYWGPEVAVALLTWASRNPDKLEAATMELVQASSGNPTSAQSTAPSVNLGRKLEYILGNAVGNPHNIERSAAMATVLSKIGLRDTAETRQLLTTHLLEVAGQAGKIQENGRILKESLLMGPGGAVKLKTIWEETKEGIKLITIEVLKPK